MDGRKVAQQVVTLKPAIAFASGIACGQRIAGRLSIGNGQPGEQALERAAQVARCAMESICNIERLKGRIPTVKDTVYQHRQLLSAQQGKRRVRGTLERDRPGRARLEQRHQEGVAERRGCCIEIGRAQNLDLNAILRGIVTAQIIGRAGDNALTRLGGSICGIRGIVGARRATGTFRARRPRYKQQLHTAAHTGTKHRAQQLNVAKSLGMRSEISREVDHAVELISLVQVAQQLFPRAVGR